MLKSTAVVLLTLSVSASNSASAYEESNANLADKSLIEILFNTQNAGCDTYPKCTPTEVEQMLIEQELYQQNFELTAPPTTEE